jgi:hypothetical protein
MTTEFNSGPPLAAEQPGSIGAAAEIYRRLERRPRRSTMKYAVPVITAAVILAGGAAAYMMLTPGAAPLSAAPPAPQLTAAAAPQLPAQPAQVAETPAPAVQTSVSQPSPPVVHRAERRERVASQAVAPRPHRAAQSAVNSGEDANAYTPPAPVTAPPAASTATPPATTVEPPAPAAPPPPS